VKFWDASPIAPLLVAEPTTRPLQALAGQDPDMLVWWGSQVECVSALTRLERAAERRPLSLQFVTLDERLAGAARKEGFELVDIAAG